MKHDLPLQEKIMLEKSLDFVSAKDQVGPTTDLFFHELVEKESKPKRYFELIAGVLGFLLFLVTFPVFSLLILITSGRPVFVKHKFVGYRGSKYERLLYRTTKRNDDSKTSLVGKFLKATGFYKLPSTLNILNGNMGLVGPQPLPIEQSEELNKRLTDFYKRHATKPGVISVTNGRSWDLSQDSRELNKSLKTELRYLVYPTLKKDFQVINGTFNAHSRKRS